MRLLVITTFSIYFLFPFFVEEKPDDKNCHWRENRDHHVLLCDSDNNPYGIVKKTINKNTGVKFYEGKRIK